MEQLNSTEQYSTEVFVPGRFEREFDLPLAGGIIRVRAVSEDCVFYDENGEPEASLFVQAYLRTDAPGEVGFTVSDPDCVVNRRPVMFLWNGGPGSSSAALQLECFGPLTMTGTPGAGPGGKEAVFDPDCILDAVDLVYIDQAGVGWSRLLKKDKAAKYYSVDGDARAYAFCIMKWLSNHGRLFSPVYLCGESYGTVRACRVVAELGRSPFSESRMVPGLPPAGVILVGNATSMCSDGKSAGGGLLEPGLELTAAAMPAMAATHYYHHSGSFDTDAQQTFIDEAWEFVRKEMTPAWFAGTSLPEEERNELAARLEHFTGLPADYWLSHALKLASEEDFLTGVCAPEGLRCDLYDTRKTSPLTGAYNAIGGGENMPLKLMNTAVRSLQGTDNARLYYTGNLTCYPLWNFATEDLPSGRRTHLECLSDAMNENPEMRVLFASGLYDLCTHAGNTRYQLMHGNLPMRRVTAREYAGGHGVYSSPEGKKAFLSDVREFIADAERERK